MTKTEARECAQTLEDVFTPEGDAVVIARLYTFPGDAGRQSACVTGAEHYMEWFHIDTLTRSTRKA